MSSDATSPLRSSPHIPGLGGWVLDLVSGKFSSFGWRELLGLEADPSTMAQWLECVHAEDQDQVRQSIDSFLEDYNATLKDFDGQPPLALQCEFRGATHGDFRWIVLRGQRVQDEHGTPIQVVATSLDVTMMRAVQREVEKSSPVESIAKAAPVLIWSSNTRGRCEWFNERWLEFTGQSLQEALATGRCGSIHPDDREQTNAAFRAAFELGDSIQLEYRLRRQDGTYHWVLDRASPRLTEAGDLDGYVGVCMDISHEYEYRQRLAERERMLARLHDINDRERTFLSCAIHDGILQDIIGADMLLQNAAKLEAEDLVKRLDFAKNTLKSALRHGRRLISELRPMILNEQGLLSAIEFYAAELENRGTIRFQITSNFVDANLCALWGGNVFRIVQSVMNNIEAHSQAESATIEISEVTDGDIRVVVRDNGVGFDYDAQRESFGLRCIRERAELFGGNVEFQSATGKGCLVVIQVPINRDNS